VIPWEFLKIKKSPRGCFPWEIFKSAEFSILLEMARLQFRCRYCSASFATKEALGGHTSDLSCRPTTIHATVVNELAAVEAAAVTNGDSVVVNADADANDDTASASAFTTAQLLQRPQFEYQNHRVIPAVLAGIERECHPFPLHQVNIQLPGQFIVVFFAGLHTQT